MACVSESAQSPDPQSGGDAEHRRWMPPGADEPDADSTKVIPSVGGAPAGGIVGDSPDDGDGAIHRTPLASDEPAGEGAGETQRPRRRLLPRRRSSPRPEEPSAPPADGAQRDEEPRPKTGRRKGRRSRRQAPAPAAGQVEPILDAKGRPATPAALRRERKLLLERRQIAVYHLGGLAFELYRRDMLPQGVVLTRAEQLAALDERVRQIDDLLADREQRRRARRAPVPSGPAGQCVACHAPFEAGARFCSTCGTRLVPDDSALSEQPTGPIGPAST